MSRRGSRPGALAGTPAEARLPDEQPISLHQHLPRGYVYFAMAFSLTSSF